MVREEGPVEKADALSNTAITRKTVAMSLFILIGFEEETVLIATYVEC